MQVNITLLNQVAYAAICSTFERTVLYEKSAIKMWYNNDLITLLTSIANFRDLFFIFHAHF